MDNRFDTELAVLKIQLEHTNETVMALRSELQNVGHTVASLNTSISKYQGAGALLIMGLTGLWAALTFGLTYFFNKS